MVPVLDSSLEADEETPDIWLLDNLENYVQHLYRLGRREEPLQWPFVRNFSLLAVTDTDGQILHTLHEKPRMMISAFSHLSQHTSLLFGGSGFELTVYLEHAYLQPSKVQGASRSYDVKLFTLLEPGHSGGSSAVLHVTTGRKKHSVHDNLWNSLE